MSQFTLLREKRFGPFFWAQAAGAANDNLIKFAVTVMVTYQLSVSWLPPAMAGLVIGALFIFPYLLFSATSGQIADKLEKRSLIVRLKDFEVLIALLAGAGLLMQSPVVMLLCIFLFGLHSTIFGPVKYSYLPQHLRQQELTGGNGMVEMGTFVSILLGNLAGGFLVSLPVDSAVSSAQAVGLACLGLAVFGRISASRIPVSPPSEPELKINWNPFTETWRNLKLAYPHTSVFRSLLGISWMWLFGSVFLAQFPAFAKDVLSGNAQVASLLLAVFSIGIAVGSLLCETLSRKLVEIGLVPLGAFGMTAFALDLYFATKGMSSGAQVGAAQFLAVDGNIRVLVDLFGLSLSAGLFSVPMYALIQLRSPATHRSRIIAANNILNALFMVVGSVCAGIALYMGASIQDLFLGLAVINAIVAVYIFTLVPEYFLRFVAFIATRAAYRFKTVNAERIPEEGAAVVVANHVSFADAVILMGLSPRPIRFVMDYRIFSTPVLGWFFKLAKAIPIAPKAQSPETYEKAFDAVDAALADGQLVCIFPEGAITRDGEMQPFKAGITKILTRRAVPVIPVGLHGLWGSFFSRKYGNAMSKPFVRGIRSAIEARVGMPVQSSQATPENLHSDVQKLLGR